jgi:bis(5'-nucleosidyl)-tetraphosphatase
VSEIEDSMKSEESVGCVMIYEDVRQQAGKRRDLFLLVQSYRGDWNFVKGHRECGESDEETLRREVYEETGIASLKVLGFVDKINYSFFGRAGQSVSKEVLRRIYRIPNYATTATTVCIVLGWYRLSVNWRTHTSACA